MEKLKKFRSQHEDPSYLLGKNDKIRAPKPLTFFYRELSELNEKLLWLIYKSQMLAEKTTSNEPNMREDAELMRKSWVALSFLCLNPWACFHQEAHGWGRRKELFFGIYITLRSDVALSTDAVMPQDLLKEPTYPFLLEIHINWTQTSLSTSLNYFHNLSLILAWCRLKLARQFYWWEWEVQRRLKAKDSTLSSAEEEVQ